ncbi:MAG: ribosome small subunit-dependent GTPase A [Eubacteriales bacterium]|nr:ribosome small subunit-dependent GTPase A [Eubacteriales bacterium]
MNDNVVTGRVIKGIGGFYYVAVADTVYECKARGKFKNEKVKILVGDIVDVDVIDADSKVGNIVHLHLRKNKIIRPEMSNIDRLFLVSALSRPAADTMNLDKMLVYYEVAGIETALVFNKCDESVQAVTDELKRIYRDAEIDLYFISARTGEGMARLAASMTGGLSVLAGPSGVGKSAIMNYLLGERKMLTGGISKKIGRGRHTTRHSELFLYAPDAYVADTPGYGHVPTAALAAEDLGFYYPEFSAYRHECKFNMCTHRHEPSCAVRDAVEAGRIEKRRYEQYQRLFEELKGRQKR